MSKGEREVGEKSGMRVDNESRKRYPQARRPLGVLGYTVLVISESMKLLDFSTAVKLPPISTHRKTSGQVLNAHL